MFLTQDERSSCLIRLRKLNETFVSSVSSEYLRAMVSEIITLVESDLELMSFDRGDDYFNSAFDSIKQRLLRELNEGSLKELHFEIASFLRNLSYGGFHNFNEHSIVRFYLDQKYPQIEYKKID
ncbi:hypothetical protein IAE39_000139 [Pseudomonas sp. S37]|nr:hypothetical protein [Pseudomonas sp. S36]MBK4991965.1 hypothetical protein [Pseudomonas sp. S37]